MLLSRAKFRSQDPSMLLRLPVEATCLLQQRNFGRGDLWLTHKYHHSGFDVILQDSSKRISEKGHAVTKGKCEEGIIIIIIIFCSAKFVAQMNEFSSKIRLPKWLEKVRRGPLFSENSLNYTRK